MEIGFELAAQLLKLGNVAMVTGRDQRQIEEAQKELRGIHGFQSDVSDFKSISPLYGVGVRRISDTLSRARMCRPASFALPSLRENRPARNPNGVTFSGPALMWMP